MKRFLLPFLIALIVLLHYTFSATIIEKKPHDRSRRCICVKIKSQCQCNNERQHESITHHQQQQFNLEQPLTTDSRTERNLSVSHQSMAHLSSCIPICFQKCMKKQYSHCQQSCQNMCKVEQSIPPTIELPQLIPQQQPQQQQQPLQIILEYLPTQHQIWEESNIQKDNTAPISRIQLSPPIPTIISNTSVLVTEPNRPSSPLSSNSIRPLTSAPHGQFPDNNNNICDRPCMPSCQCNQQSPSTSASLLQQQHPSESVVHQPLMSDGPLRQESAANNGKIPLRTQTSSCASFCMPSCREQCIHQIAMSLSAFYSTPSPALPSLSQTVQSKPTVFEMPEFKQEHSAEAEKIPINEVHQTQHSFACLFICKNNCMQQCVQQNGSAEQCDISCTYACHDNCAQQYRQQQQQPELIHDQVLSQPIHQQSQQISIIQHPPSLLTRFQQVQQMPVNEISRDQLLLQQRLTSSQQTPDISQYVPRIITSTNLEVHVKRKLK
uniref:Protein kinase domain-containing protein n=1 Tax=Elaeophora elaphi TaxID=1147741 RepID=A0A0R3RQL3_9BILA